MDETVWIVCNCEVYAKKAAALAAVREMLETGATHFEAGTTHRKIMDLLLECGQVETALDYWNSNCPNKLGGTDAPISFRDAEVRR